MSTMLMEERRLFKVRLKPSPCSYDTSTLYREIDIRTDGQLIMAIPRFVLGAPGSRPRPSSSSSSCIACPCRSVAVSTISRHSSRLYALCRADHRPRFWRLRSFSTVRSHVCRGRPRGRVVSSPSAGRRCQRWAPVCGPHLDPNGRCGRRISPRTKAQIY